MSIHRSKPVSSTGHTLIEVVIVLAIVAVLTAAAMQGWQHLVRRQQRAEAKAALLDVMQQQESHRSRHGRYPSHLSRRARDRDSRSGS